jgi:hypothetical protein
MATNVTLRDEPSKTIYVGTALRAKVLITALEQLIDGFDEDFSPEAVAAGDEADVLLGKLYELQKIL